MSLTFPRPEQRVDAALAFNAGVVAMRQGDDATAVAHWQRARDLDPTLVPALHNLVVYHEERDQFDEVARLYAQLLAINPWDTRALIRQATAQRRLGQMGEAIANYERALRLYPWVRCWYHELAQLCEQAGRPHDAAAWQQQADLLDTDALEMACEDGWRHLRRGNHALAIACMEAVLEESPGNLDASLGMARALSETGQHPQGLEVLQALLNREDIPHALVRFHRARLLWQAGRGEEACTDLQIAAEEAPDFGRAELLLQLLTPLVATGADATGPLSQPGDPAGVSRTGQSTSAAPAARRAAPWEDAVMASLVSHATQTGPGGISPRFALIIEPNAALAPLALRLVDMLHALQLPLAQGRVSPVLMLESESRPGEGTAGVVRSGWLGSQDFPDVRLIAWNNVSSGVPLDQLFHAAASQSPEGYSAVLILSTGRARGDQAALQRVLRALPCHHILSVVPHTHSSDVAARLMAVAERWTQYEADPT
jgi:tetratricopeptide (TPR) repeat protein